LQLLENWTILDRTHLIALLGMGGMGKSALAIRLVEQIAPQFDFVIWRSLRNAPPLNYLLIDLIQYLSQQRETQTDLPSDSLALIQKLIQYLRSTRCLVVLDNAETLMRQGERLGRYRDGYEDYGELLRQIGEARHQSCVVLTSREKLPEVATLEGDRNLVRSHHLTGLDSIAAEAIFQQRASFSGSNADWQAVIQQYAGNPLALKIVACAIEELFNCDVGEFVAFLQTQTLVFDDIRDLLDRQFERLTDLEQEVMVWLAINREFVSFAELQADLVSAIAKRQLPETLKSLVRRSLIETQAGQFTQQPVVMEYMTEKLIDRICVELRSWDLADHPADWQQQFFHRYAIVKVTSKDYLKSSQLRVILSPLLERLKTDLNPASAIASRLQQILLMLRSGLSDTPSYSSGNLINLLRGIQVDLSGFDFSHLCLWQADLQGIPLHQVNLRSADLSKSVFSETLGAVFSVAFLPDGIRFISGDTQGNVCLWNAQTGQRLRVYGQFSGWVTSLGVSPDGQTIAAGAGTTGASIRTWQTETGNELHRLPGHTGSWVSGLVFTADGQQLISAGGEDACVRRWDMQTGDCLQCLEYGSMIWAVALSPDEQWLATGHGDRTITITDLATGDRRNLIGHGNEVESVNFSPDGDRLVSGSSDYQVKLWDVVTGECLQTLTGHHDQVWETVFSPDGRLVASSSMDCTVKIWDSGTGQCLRTLEGYEDHVYGLEFSHSGDLLLTGSMDYTVRVWQVATGTCLKLWRGSKNVAWAVQFVPDEDGREAIAAAWRDGVIRVWSDEPTEVRQLQGHQAWARAIAVVPSGSLGSKTIVTGADDGLILWDLATGKILRRYAGHSRPVTSLAVTPDGRTLISGGMDRLVKVWDLHTGDCLQVLSQHQHWVFAVAVSPEGNYMATVSLDGTAKLWSLRDYTCLHTFTGHRTRVFSVVFSVDGRYLFTGSADHGIKVWDVQTGDCLNTLTGHQGWVFSLVVSPDGRWLASGSDDTTVRLWPIEGDLSQLETASSRVLVRHQQSVFSVAFSADSQRLVSSGYDEMLYIWDVTTGNYLQTRSPQKLYAGMDITGAIGLTEAQRLTLRELGAVDGLWPVGEHRALGGAIE
jgi:WD40 repeat protein